MSFKDKTYCASPNCVNECGRKMSDADKAQLYNLTWKNPLAYSGLVSYGYFCGEPKTCKHDWEQSSFIATTCKLCGEKADD